MRVSNTGKHHGNSREKEHGGKINPNRRYGTMQVGFDGRFSVPEEQGNIALG